MPFTNRQVSPAYLSKKCISGDSQVDDVLETVSNNTLAETLRQLASLVLLADNIFGRVHVECQRIFDRTESVKNKFYNVSQVVVTLDAKTVEIPESDLKSFVRIKNHYVSNYNAENVSRDLFLPENRPSFVKNLYSSAAETPTCVIQTINQYRESEKPSSNAENIDIETRKPAMFLKLLNGTARTDDENLNSSTETLTASSKILPSPEEITKATAEEYPASLIPIDVTGSGFNRMTTFRRSLLQITFLERRKKKKKSKRRNTICEGDSTLKREVQDALTQTESTSSKSLNRKSFVFLSRRKSADMLDSQDSIFLENTLNKDKKCVSTSCQTEEVGQNPNELRPVAVSTSALNDKGKSHKSNNFLSGFLRASRSKFLRNSQTSVDKEAKKTKNGTRKGKGVIPISTFSQAMNMAVKMRDGVRTGKSSKDEDRQSSSGNWSATSSTRTSFDSDSIHKNMNLLPPNSMIPYNSQDTAVLLKESHFDNGSQDEGVTGASGYTSDSTITGTMSTSSFAFHPNYRKLNVNNTNKWLNNHPQMHLNSSVDEHTSDGDLTPLALSPFSMRKHKNSNNTDDESSVYSVDTDGYFTSMHSDSGLRMMTIPSPSYLSSTPSQTSKHFGVNISNADTICIRKKDIPPKPPKRTSCRPNSIILQASSSEQNLDLDGKDEASVNDEKQSDGTTSHGAATSSSCSDGSDVSTPSSESDPDAANRFRDKTEINSFKYPSLVHVSESEDDHESKSSEKIVVCMKKKPLNCDTYTTSFGTSTVANSPPFDIQKITYPIASIPTSENHYSDARFNSKRPNTLNLYSSNISEHDVPMLQKQYSIPRSPVPSLYCDSLLRQKSSLKRSQSMKQPQSPLNIKSGPIISSSNCPTSSTFSSSYSCSSLGRRKNRLQMNIESTIAAQVPLSKKYSTLPTRFRHSDKSSNDVIPSSKTAYDYGSLDRRSLRSGKGINKYGTNGQARIVPSSPLSKTINQRVRLNPNSPVLPKPNQYSMKPSYQHSNTSANKSPVKNFKVAPIVPPKPKIKVVRSASNQTSDCVNAVRNVSSFTTDDGSSPEKVITPPKCSVSPKLPSYLAKKKKSKITSEDLFAIIHNSKKKMNIKTDSSPMSSRCTSPNSGRFSNGSSRASTPGCISPTPSVQSTHSNVENSLPARTAIAESGVLGPRFGSVKNVAGERRSWAAGSRATSSPTPNGTNEKKSLAIDRLRNGKPTSIADFKKLLLQTKTPSNHQKSASEILRATSPVPSKSLSSPPSSNNSHFRPITPVTTSSSMKINHPPSSMRQSSNRSSSPFKRGNRLRSSLPTNSLITSPIWEDTGECEPSSNKPIDAKNMVTRNKMFGYLTQGNGRNPYIKYNSGEPILHIPTRSALESSV